METTISTTGRNPRQLVLIASAALLLVAFFLSWVNIGGGGPSGLAIASTPNALVALGAPEVGLAALLYAVPVLATLALVLAIVGIYGVTAFVTGQRTRELGLRMAVGASSTDVLRLLLELGMASHVLFDISQPAVHSRDRVAHVLDRAAAQSGLHLEVVVADPVRFAPDVGQCTHHLVDRFRRLEVGELQRRRHILGRRDRKAEGARHLAGHGFADLAANDVMQSYHVAHIVT